MIKLNSIYKSKIKYISGDDDYILKYNAVQQNSNNWDTESHIQRLVLVYFE